MIRESTEISDGGLEWLDADGPDAEVVLSTRVRLARNLENHRFGVRADDAERQAILDAARTAANQASAMSEGRMLDMHNLSEASRRILLERHLVSKELIGEDHASPPGSSALFLAHDDALGIMVNEEDHLRLQSLMSGFRLREAWETCR